jgi:hypothetical protein
VDLVGSGEESVAGFCAYSDDTLGYGPMELVS